MAEDNAGETATTKKTPAKASRKSSKKGPAKRSTARTADQKAIDARVEAETKRQNKVRAEQEKTEQARRESDFKVSENSLGTRAADASIGLIEHFGCSGRYVGVAPQFEKGQSKCPNCQQVLTGGNSKFYPLTQIVPEAGLLVKDPHTGTFFALPADGTLVNATADSWLTIVNPETGKGIIPEANKEAAKARRAAAGLD